MKKTITLCLILCIVSALFPAGVLAADTDIKEGYTYIILTPESFLQRGIWKLYPDKDYENMPYLLGGTDGTPSPDNPAKTSVVLPKMGAYTIHALSKDYATDPGTRFYRLDFGDESLTLGNHGMAGWHWQKSDALYFFGGETEVVLTDTSGTFPRCAMLVITDDPDFNPGSDMETVTALSAEKYQDGDYTFSQESILSGRPDKEIAVQLNGSWMNFDVDPVLMNDRTMVPFRAIFEALGCTVSWDDATQTASGERNGIKVALPIGSKTVNVSGQGMVLDQPAELVNDRTLVPLRFVSESLGAKVTWLEDSQTVLILADVPAESVLFTMASFIDAGTWTAASQATGAFTEKAFHGTTPDDGRVGATVEDADASQNKPAVANFKVSGGTYRIWVRSRDFAENQQGDRYLNIGFDGEMLEHKYGTHGKNGYAWATGGTVTLNAGEHTLYVYDTSGFYARFDAVFLTKDTDYVPSESYDTLARIARPVNGKIELSYTFPAYAKEQNAPTDSITLENEYTKVIFYKIPTASGQVVQNEIYSKYNGEWILTNSREEELGYLVMQADESNSNVVEDSFSINTTYQFEGQTYGGLTSNPYEAGVGTWFIPEDFTTDGNSVTLIFPENETGTMTAVWSLDGTAYPKVSADTTFKNAGYYSVAAWEGASFSESEVEYALAPFRVQYKRIPDTPELLSESYLFTPMGTYTLPENNAYATAPVTKGIVLEPSWIPLRWVYKDNCKFGISMKSSDNLCRGTVFAPAMGTEESKMDAGESYNLQYRVVSRVADWFQNYEHIACGLFGITDYRENYSNSLNDVIYNTRALMLDDDSTGWDAYSKGFYNMEGKNVATNGNPMQMLQEYLLTDSEDILTRRAIPTIANTLTRKERHFNRVGERGGAGWAESSGDPDTIGEPVANFNANVIGGMYEMTRGAVPYLHSYSLEKGSKDVVSTSASIAPFANDLSMYKYTGEQKYLDSAILKADAYLEEIVYGESTETPAWQSFIYTSYFPSLASLIDIYEVTEDEKYLVAAEDVAKWMSTALWVPGIDGDKKTQLISVNGPQYMEHNNLAGMEITTSSHFWWYGDRQYRVGRSSPSDTAGTDKVLAAEKQVEGWIPSRVGLGLEQASTFTRSSNIIMQCFAGDFMKLTAYTGNDYYATLARNAIIGRFKSYDGYYRSCFSTYELEVDYPREGPDYTSIYWHHIPPYLAMLEDFLINQAFAWSNRNISFPSLRQQGYAYFNSNQYGFAPGTFYGEEDMWLWLDDGVIKPDSIQIDYILARKDGVLGIALMNESDTDITTTVTFGEKLPGSFSTTAALYDENRKCGTAEITDGSFTVTVPAKNLSAVILKTDSVTAPSYASLPYEETDAQIGATVSGHTNGKGYVLQMSPDCYYAYLYITDLPKEVTALTVTYDAGNGTQMETTGVYPYEFIIKSEDVTQAFRYSLRAVMADGTEKDYGSGTLMTAALSREKGVSSTEPDTQSGSGTPGIADPATADAKNLKFEAFTLKYRTQGVGETGLRFVVNLNDLPFTPTAANVVGLPVTGKVIDSGKEIPFTSQIVGYEPRSDTECTLIIEKTAEISSYTSTYENPNYTWDAIISPAE